MKALAVTPDGVIFAGTDGAMGSGIGLLRSLDNGTTWGDANGGLLDSNIQALLATRQGRLFAGTTLTFHPQGICLYRSTDGGDYWSYADSGLVGSGAVYSLAEDSTGDLFCGSGLYGVHRSTDAGGTWIPTTPLWPGVWVEGFAINREGTIFAGTLTYGVFRSTDKGATWIEVNNGLGQGIPLITTLAVSRGGVLFAGKGYGGGVYRSIDNGDTWVRTNLESGDVRALTLSPNGTLFVGTLGKGIFWSTDNGETWLQDNSGLPQFGVWSLAASHDGYIFAGTDSGGIFRSVHSVTSTEDSASSLPTTLTLFQNYPNPFNPTTGIRYHLPGVSDVKLVVYDLLGREVQVLVNEKKAPGSYEVNFDASALASGVYIYRLQAGGFVQSRKLLLVR